MPFFLLSTIQFLLQPVSCSTCLSDGIPEADREGLDGVTGYDSAIGVYRLLWDSDELVVEIFSLLVGEVLGLKVVESGSASNGRKAIFAQAECKFIEEDSSATCSDDMYEHTTHVTLEVWSGQLYHYEWLQENHPDRAPEDLGSMGYEGFEGVYIGRTPLANGMNDAGQHLELYGFYNASWWNPSSYFDNLTAIDTDVLVPCEDAAMSDASVMANVVKFAPDPEGLDEEGKAICYENHWWLSPSCRSDPGRCVPFLTFTSWLILPMMQKAIAFNIPLAFATLTTWNNYLTVPLGHDVLFYSWGPAMHFYDMSPELLVFPAHDSAAYEAGDERTAKSNVELKKFAHRTLSTVAPSVYSLLSDVTFNMNEIEDMFGKVLGGMTYAEAACDWVLANQETWMEWIPDATDCSEGRGLVNSDGNFVHIRSSAVGCSPCVAGFYSVELEDDQGITSTCMECGAGEYQAMWGSSTCDQCEVGYYQNDTGQSQCVRCSQGTFANQTGLSLCSICPEGRTTDGTGYRSIDDCLCPAGYFMFPGTNTCVACGDHGFCNGFGAEPLVLKGYQLDAVDSDGLSVFQCSEVHHCPGGGIRVCAPGRQGIACGRCKADMIPGDNGACVSCKPADKATLALTLICAVVVVVLLYIAMSRQDKARQSTTVVLFMTIMAQFLSLMQLMSVLSQLAIEWPEPLKSLVELFSMFSFNLEVLRIGCLGDFDNASVYVWKLLTLPSAIIFLYVFHIIVSKVLGRKYRDSVSDAFVGAVGVLFMAFFVTISVTTFLPFQCVQHPNGRWTMLQFESEECWVGGSHTSMLVAAGIGMVMPLAFIAGVSHLLRSLPSRLQAGDLAYLRRYSFVYARVRPQMRWFILCVLLRNLSVAFVLMVPNPFWQVFLMQCIFIAAFGTVLRISPWVVPAANVLDAAGTTFVLLLFTLSAFFTPNADSEALGQLAFGLMLGGIALLPATASILLTRRLVHIKKRYRWFICHQKASAGASARVLKMSLVDANKDNVFLDSDNLKDLSLLFSIVKNDTQCLLVLASRALLGSPWCMGEITTAHFANVHCQPVHLPCWNLEYVDDGPLEAEKHSEWPRLGEAGLGHEHVRQALQWFARLPSISVDDHVSVSDLNALATLVKQSRSNSMMESRTTTASRLSQLESPRVCPGMAFAVMCMFCTASRLEEMRERWRTQTMTHDPMKIPTIWDASAVAIAAEDWSEKVVVLMLSSSCFHSNRFLSDLLDFAGVRLKGLVPVVTSDIFNYPTQRFYKELRVRVREMGLEADEDRQESPEVLPTFVEAVFERICKRFTPHSGIAILRMEADVIKKEVEGCTAFIPMRNIPRTESKKEERSESSAANTVDGSGGEPATKLHEVSPRSIHSV